MFREHLHARAMRPQFFDEHTLEKNWHTFELVRPPHENKLPVVLSVQEVQRILSA